MDAAERLQGKLVRYTSRFFAGDENSARDVVQHAFMQLCRVNVDSRPENIDAWLYRVCRNRAIDQCRRDERMQTGDHACVNQQIDAGVSSSQQLTERELWQLIQERIAVLPASQREAVELWSAGMRYAEIAEIMGRVETSIRVMVHRAITRLRNDPQIRLWLSDDGESQSSIIRDKITTNC